MARSCSGSSSGKHDLGGGDVAAGVHDRPSERGHGGDEQHDQASLRLGVRRPGRLLIRSVANPIPAGILRTRLDHAAGGSSRTWRLRWSVMSVARPSRLRLKPASELRPGIVAAIGALVAALAVVAVATHPSWDRWVLAAVIGGSLAAVSLERPRTAAVVALLGLPFLALLRRLLIPVAPWTSHDPLLAVGPLLAMVILARLWIGTRPRLAPDLLSKLVLALLAVALLATLNLNGSGVGAALGGLVFIGLPLLWFFVGRELGAAEGRADAARRDAPDRGRDRRLRHVADADRPPELGQPLARRRRLQLAVHPPRQRVHDPGVRHVLERGRVRDLPGRGGCDRHGLRPAPEMACGAGATGARSGAGIRLRPNGAGAHRAGDPDHVRPSVEPAPACPVGGRRRAGPRSTRVPVRGTVHQGRHRGAGQPTSESRGRGARPSSRSESLDPGAALDPHARRHRRLGAPPAWLRHRLDQHRLERGRAPARRAATRRSTWPTRSSASGWSAACCC